MNIRNTTTYLWSIWAKALGNKASHNSKHSDHVALIRTIIFLTYLITNAFIIANAVRHWNTPNHHHTPIIINI
jgi:hypothetical protein